MYNLCCYQAMYVGVAKTPERLHKNFHALARHLALNAIELFASWVVFFVLFLLSSADFFWFKIYFFKKKIF